jgi:hypothetical protein
MGKVDKEEDVWDLSHKMGTFPHYTTDFLGGDDIPWF